MGQRNLNLQMREDKAHAPYLKKSQDQTKALVATQMMQLMSLKRWQSHRRAKAEAERAKCMAKMASMFDDKQDF